jgi:hypothetical protein
VAPIPAAEPPSANAGVDQGKAEVDKCLAEVNKLMASGDFKKALDVLNKFPGQWQSQYFGQPIVERRKEVELAIQAKFNRDIEEAKRQRIDGKLAESRVVLEKIKTYLPPTMRDEYGDYQEALEKLEAREKEAGPALQAQKAQEVEKLRAEAHRVAMQYLQDGKLDDGITKIQAMKSDPKYASLGADLELDLKDLLRAREFGTAIAEGGKNLIGQPLTARGIPGTLKSFDDDQLVLTAKGMDLPPHKVHDLRPKELMALAAGSTAFKSKDEGEQRLMCALYLVSHKQTDLAGSEFEAAKKAGVDISRYATLVPAKKPSGATGTPRKKSKTK